MSPSNIDKLEADFVQLLSRCQKSIDEALPLNTDDLIETDLLYDQKDRNAGHNSKGWAIKDSDLYAVFKTIEHKGVITQRKCSIYPREGKYILSDEKQAYLIRQFLMWKIKHLANGKHERSSFISPIYPIINIGFNLKDLNPRGCNVVHTMSYLPDGEFFVASSAEQAITKCTSL